MRTWPSRSTSGAIPGTCCRPRDRSISLGLRLQHDRHTRRRRRADAAPAIARYAWGDDYHDVIRARLDALRRLDGGRGRPGLEARVVRRHRSGAGARLRGARRARLDRQEHLRHQPDARIVDLSRRDHLERGARADAPALDQCGTCTRCLEACPTGAIVDAVCLDATRCISYLTIERAARVAEALRPAIGSHVYGCDICQDVCPWNRRAAVERRSGVAAARPGSTCAELIDLVPAIGRRVARGS